MEGSSDANNEQLNRSLNTGEILLAEIDKILNDEIPTENDSDTSSVTSKSISPLSQNLCHPVDERILTLPPMLHIDPLPNHIPIDNIDVNRTDTDNLRKFINKQCFEGYKWSHSLIFEGSRDQKILNQWI